MNRPVRTHLSSKSLSLIGVPKKFQNKTIEDYKDFNISELKETKEFFTDYLNHIDKAYEDNQGLLIYGSNGVGKTFLSCLVAKEAYRRRYSVKRTTFVQYVEAYTRLWNCRDLEEKDVLESDFYSGYKAVEFLILEELGKEIDSKISAPVLEDCLRYREDNDLVTIICTNLNLPDLKERYGNSVFSLMQGNMIPVCINNKDRRRTYFNQRG